MKIYNLLQARKTLSAHTSEPLPTHLAYKIIKFLKGTDTEADFYNEKFNVILSKYKDTNSTPEDGKIRIRPESVDVCQKELQELNDTDVEVPAIKFKIDELSAIQFSVQELFSLDEMIEEV